MLSDFLLLETYYDAPDTVQIYEDLAGKYGRAVVARAVEAGYIMASPARCIGWGTSSLRCWLTDKGRKQATKNDDRAVPV
jgi:hypothetical protein